MKIIYTAVYILIYKIWIDIKFKIFKNNIKKNILDILLIVIAVINGSQ